MAQKKFQISQRVNLNGVLSNRYATVVCDETEIDSVLATLEGEYSVMVEHASGGSDAVVASYNLLQRITFKAEGMANMTGAIFASNGGLAIKNNLSIDELTDVVAQLHPFTDDISKKPSRDSIKPVVLAGAVATAP